MLPNNIFVKVLLTLAYLAFYALASLIFGGGVSNPVYHIVFHAGIILFICMTYDFLYPSLLMGFSSSRKSMPSSRLGRFVRLTGAMHEHADLDSLFAFTSKALEGVLGLESSSIYYHASSDQDDLEEGMVLWQADKHADAGGNPERMRSDCSLLQYARGKHAPFFAVNSPYSVRSQMAAYGSDFAIPAHSGARLYCIILPGKSMVKRDYSADELSLLDFLCTQLNIAIERIDAIRRQQSRKDADYAEKMSLLANLSANIAHEMRTPLSGVRASIAGVESYLPDLINAYQAVSAERPNEFRPIRADHIEMLKFTPKRIKNMVDQANTVIDLLLVNLRDRKLDAASFTLCSMTECVQEALDTYPFKRSEREKLKIDLGQDFSFLGIKSLMVYVIFNLLKNALYSIEAACKGEISIVLERGEPFDKLIFTDTGLGIDSESLPRIFEGFFTTKSDGTGAGLAFCRRTLESFGGRITAEAKQGEYTRFILELPARP
ncbi:MAG: ATP-binding protein [Pseudohongiellaceae bacterium]|nr:ATP-binding protein [Pseudohongiellaceae bacterium]